MERLIKRYDVNKLDDLVVASDLLEDHGFETAAELLRSISKSLSNVYDSFSKFLISNELVSQEQAAEAFDLTNHMATDFGQALLMLGYVDETNLAKARAKFGNVRYVDLDTSIIPTGAAQWIPEAVARENLIVPLHRLRNRILIAFVDPIDFDTIEKIRFILNQEISVVVGTESGIVKAIDRIYGIDVDDSNLHHHVIPGNYIRSFDRRLVVRAEAARRASLFR